MLTDDIEIQAQVKFRGKLLFLNKIMSQFTLDELTPPRDGFCNPMDLVRLQERAERRGRFVDMIAAEFAHALTEAIFKAAK